jgi:hypothetical protein
VLVVNTVGPLYWDFWISVLRGVTAVHVSTGSRSRFMHAIVNRVLRGTVAPFFGAPGAFIISF